MPSQTYFEQQRAIAEAKAAMIDAMRATGETDLAVWIAVFADLLRFVSDSNLQHERGEAGEVTPPPRPDPSTTFSGR